MKPEELWALPIPHAAEAHLPATVGAYVSTMLVNLLEEEEGFSGKRPLGDSGWFWDLATALAFGGAIEVSSPLDEDYYPSSADLEAARRFLTAAVKATFLPSEL